MRFEEVERTGSIGGAPPRLAALRPHVPPREVHRARPGHGRRLSRVSRQARAPGDFRRRPRARVREARDGRHAKNSLSPEKRRRRRGVGAHPERDGRHGANDRVRLLAARVRDELSVLLHGEDGASPKPHHFSDCRASRAREADGGVRGPQSRPRRDERGVHGHGRAPAQHRRRARGGGHPHRSARPRAVAQQGDGVDLGPRARDGAT